jgi:hypothetical protein
MSNKFKLVQMITTSDHNQACLNFSRFNNPKREKIHQITIKYTKWPQNIPNGHKIYRHLPLQDTPRFTQIGIFGLKIRHLATLAPTLTPDSYFHPGEEIILRRYFNESPRLSVPEDDRGFLNLAMNHLHRQQQQQQQQQQQLQQQYHQLHQQQRQRLRQQQ